jgi:hypothetical protein
LLLGLDLSCGRLDVLAANRRVTHRRLRAEALDRGAACRRNAVLVGGQATTDALTVWDELPANREGI